MLLHLWMSDHSHSSALTEVPSMCGGICTTAPFVNMNNEHHLQTLGHITSGIAIFFHITDSSKLAEVVVD